MKQIWIGIGIFAGVLVIGLAGYLGFHSSSPQASPKVQAPQTAPVTRCDVTQTVAAPGSVANFQEAVIQMPFNGTLTEIDVQAGEAVRKARPWRNLMRPIRNLPWRPPKWIWPS